MHRNEVRCSEILAGQRENIYDDVVSFRQLASWNVGSKGYTDGDADSKSHGGRMGVIRRGTGNCRDVERWSTIAAEQSDV